MGQRRRAVVVGLAGYAAQLLVTTVSAPATLADTYEPQRTSVRCAGFGKTWGAGTLAANELGLTWIAGPRLVIGA